MQLTNLEIFGFKSFAERTKFNFDKGITGIVGPNGCGKSNVVDAMRWVLGEQKTRNLRSDKMENIIFNGTSKKKRANFAEVSLTFENTRNILPTEYATVTITRKLYRNGDSEYYLNGVSCRLKDIQNLFLDTGIGSDSYAIIELKMVDEILNDKDNSRRILFEEAAGIAKYKIRKKQTLKRLGDTEADLDRVEDILFEISKNLKTLENQAKKARRYFNLKDKYKLISSQHAFFTIGDLRASYEQVEVEEKKLEDLATEIQATIAKHEARVLELKKDQVNNEQILSDAQKDLNRHSEKITKIETDKSIRNERLKYLQQREYAIGNQLETDKRQLAQNEEAIAGLDVQIAEKRKGFEEKSAALATLKAKVDERRAQVDELKKEAGELEKAFQQTERSYLDAIKEIEIKSIQVEGLKQELERNEADRNSRSTELTAFGPALEELRKETKSLDDGVTAQRAEIEAHEQEMESTRDRVNELKDEVYKCSRKLDARLNEYKLTKSLVENLEGFPESVKFLKKDARWVKDAPLLSDIFYAPEAYKVAFENLLEQYLSYYVVDTTEDALAAVKLLSDASKGRANFFIMDALGNYSPRKKVEFPGAVPATEVVEFAEKYYKLAAFLLDKVYVVDDENQIPEDLPDGLVFVTASGNVSRGKYTLSGGSIGLFQGKRLGRARNLEKLDKEIKKFEKESNKLKTELDREERKLQELRSRDFKDALEEKNKILREKLQSLSVLEAREKEYREFLELAGQRTEDIREQISAFESDIVNLRPRTEELKAQTAVQKEAAGQLKVRLEQDQQELQALSGTYNQDHISFIQLQNLLENLERDQRFKSEQIERLKAGIEKAKAELEQTSKDIHELVENSLQNDEEIVALYEVKKEKEQRREKYEQIAAQIRSSIEQQEQGMRKKRQDRDELDERRGNFREKVTEIKIELNSLKERMSVEFEVDISDLEEEILFEKGVDQYDSKKITEEMYAVRERLQRFGEINPMAVEAYDEMKERYDFIQEQKGDLEDAKATLLNTIAEIDQTATEKFKEAFIEIRTNFKDVFQRLFYEGDTCDLTLVTPDDPLESKIEITAKPKGKRPLTINQLSGGEKTLTAVALLFAIYLRKPAPFCIFDEVDAPLDDANIDKFNNIIREFSSDSQFIVVTHNKRTMAATNIMYGVTMEQQGISKVLPVDLVALNLN